MNDAAHLPLIIRWVLVLWASICCAAFIAEWLIHIVLDAVRISVRAHDIRQQLDGQCIAG